MGEQVYERQVTRGWWLAGLSLVPLMPALSFSAVACGVQGLLLLQSSTSLVERLLASAQLGAALVLGIGFLFSGLGLQLGMERRFARCSWEGDRLRFQPRSRPWTATVPWAAVEQLEETPHGVVVHCGRGRLAEWLHPLLVPTTDPAVVAALFAAHRDSCSAPVDPAARYRAGRARPEGAMSPHEVLIVLAILMVLACVLLPLGLTAADPLELLAWGVVFSTVAALALVILYLRSGRASCRVGDGTLRFQGHLNEETVPIEAVAGHRLELGRGLWLRIPTRGWRERYVPRLLPAPTSEDVGAALAALHAGGARCCVRAGGQVEGQGRALAVAPPGARTRFPALKGRTPTT